MKKIFFKFFLLGFLLSLFSLPSFGAESQPESKPDSEKKEGKFESAGHDMEKGFKKAGKGIEKGGKTAGKGIKTGGKKTGKAFKKTGHSIDDFFTK